MATKKPELIGIQSVPLPEAMGAYKYSKSDWTMIAYMIPRWALRKIFTDKGLQHNAIYFLVGNKDLTERVYVGQAKKRNQGESVLKRLREHNDSKTESYRALKGLD